MRSCPPISADRFATALLRRYSKAEVRSLLAPAGPAEGPLVAEVRADPARIFAAAGLAADPWQAAFLADPARRRLMLCCRRAGKSLVSAAKTLQHCLSEPNRVALVFSPTRRQSQEYTRYVNRFDKALGHPVKVTRRSMGETEWANGSRVLSLPDSPEGVVGVGGNPTRLVIDEASRVSDPLYLSIRPMLALGAELEVLSTPFGKRGWFFDIFNTPRRLALFRTWQVTAREVPRITPEFLAEERVELGDRWFNQEYFLKFTDSVDAVFAQDVIAAARADDIEPLFDLGV